MKRMMWLAGACLLGGLMVVTVVSGLRAPVRAAEVMAPAANVRDVVINELAWMGTADNTADEWIEFYNNTAAPIDIGSWSIYGADTGVCLNFSAAVRLVLVAVSRHLNPACIIQMTAIPAVSPDSCTRTKTEPARLRVILVGIHPTFLS